MADKWREDQERVEKGEVVGKALDSLRVKRYLCRRIFFYTYEAYDEIVKFHIVCRIRHKV